MTETLSGLGRLAFRTLTANGARSVRFTKMDKAYLADLKKLGLQDKNMYRTAWYMGAKSERLELTGR